MNGAYSTQGEIINISVTLEVFTPVTVFWYVTPRGLVKWYSTFFVRLPPGVISLQFCIPKVVGV
jgi:hypothetical protein